MKENQLPQIAATPPSTQTNQSSNPVNLVQIVKITAGNFEEFYNLLILGNLTPAICNPDTMTVTLM